jgi:hypothetical protein
MTIKTTYQKKCEACGGSGGNWGMCKAPGCWGGQITVEIEIEAEIVTLPNGYISVKYGNANNVQTISLNDMIKSYIKDLPGEWFAPK